MQYISKKSCMIFYLCHALAQYYSSIIIVKIKSNGHGIRLYLLNKQ